MTLRPRYSLLTLLILTALVAGGVKLWYGPHHVVEWTEPGYQVEYTFTRNWRGEQVIEGPQIFRSRLPDGRFLRTVIVYHRKGRRLPWFYEIYCSPELIPVLRMPYHSGSFSEPPTCPLTPEEQLKCRRLIQLERPRTLDEGVIILVFDGQIYDGYLEL